jgi:hypothetical protein
MVAERAGIRWTGDVGVTAFTTDVAAVSSINAGGDNDHATGYYRPILIFPHFSLFFLTF